MSLAFYDPIPATLSSIYLQLKLNTILLASSGQFSRLLSHLRITVAVKFSGETY